MSCRPSCVQFWRVSAKCGKQGWKRHLVTNSPKRCSWRLTTSLNPTSHVVDGKRRLPKLWTTLLRGPLASCVGAGARPDQVPDRACPHCRSLPCPRADFHSLTPSPSVCSSCATPTFPSLSPHASANVAVHSILVTTIGPCAVAGVLGRRGHPLESAAARVCREAGARVRTNVVVRGVDLLLAAALDGRRLVDGLFLYRGAQLATDTKLVAVLKRDGTPRTGADRTNGVGACFCSETQGAHSPRALR